MVRRFRLRAQQPACSCSGASFRLTINRTYRTEDVAREIAAGVRAKGCAAVRM